MTPIRKALLQAINDGFIRRSTAPGAPRWFDRRTYIYARRDQMEWLIKNGYVVIEPGWKLLVTNKGVSELAL